MKSLLIIFNIISYKNGWNVWLWCSFKRELKDSKTIFWSFSHLMISFRQTTETALEHRLVILRNTLLLHFSILIFLYFMVNKRESGRQFLDSLNFNCNNIAWSTFLSFWTRTYSFDKTKKNLLFHFSRATQNVISPQRFSSFFALLALVCVTHRFFCWWRRYFF